MIQVLFSLKKKNISNNEKIRACSRDWRLKGSSCPNDDTF